MAKLSAKNAIIKYATLDISKDCVSYTITDAYDTVEVTGFGEGSRNYVPGILTGNVSVDILWNSSTDGAFGILNSLIGTTGSTLAIYPESTSVKGWKGVFFLKGISPSGSPGSEVKLGTCEFVVSGAVAPAWSTA